MSEVDWSSLPVLPLKCILEYLSVREALNTTSVCRNWRLSMLVYEGRRETLKLYAKDVQQAIFRTQIFRRNTKNLIIYLDCADDEVENFIEAILPRFYDIPLLYELTIIGSKYLLNKDNSKIKINRQITEKLMHAHRHTLKSMCLIGCEFDSSVDTCEDDNAVSTTGLSFLSTRLESFGCKTGGVKSAVFSNLHSLFIDYENIDLELLEGLTSVPQLSLLTLTLRNGKGKPYGRIPNTLLYHECSTQLEVAVNIFEVPSYRIQEIMENVLVKGLPLVTIRVLFCKYFHEPLLEHLVRFSGTLRELDWSDAPFDSHSSGNARIKSIINPFGVINPFIMICWRCTNMTSLTIFGYWVKSYDLIGMARLRAMSLTDMMVPCIASHRLHPGAMAPVLIEMRDLPMVQRTFVQQMNQCLNFKWAPTRSWSILHPALTPDTNPERRADYVLLCNMRHCYVP